MSYFFMFLVAIVIFIVGYLIGNYLGYVESQNSIVKINRIIREMRKIKEKRKSDLKLISHIGGTYKKGGKYSHPLSKYKCYDCGSLLRIGGAISEGVGENAKVDDIFFCENCEAMYYGKKELTLSKDKRCP